MNINVKKENLTRLLYLTNTIVERKNTMPVLANVKLTAEKNSLSVGATDLEVSLLGSTEAEVESPGSITVSGKVLYEIVRELPEENVKLKVTKGQRFEIESGQSRFKINGISSDEFPSIMGLQLNSPASVSAETIYEMLEKTAYAVSLDETRYNITGVCVETHNEQKKPMLRFAATDGHRLSYIDREADGLAMSAPVILPRKGIQELKKLLDGNESTLQVSVNEGFFTVKADGVVLGIRLVDGQFPDYRQVIPKETKSEATISKQELLAAVRRVSLVTTDKSRSIRFRALDSSLLISSSSPEYGEASETIPISKKGEDVTVGFSGRYILDILNAMQRSETITMKLSSELGPGILLGDGDEDYSCVVMPMRFE